MKYYIVGLGGIGGHLCDLFARSSASETDEFVLIDGDMYEQSNARRQRHTRTGEAKVAVVERLMREQGINNVTAVHGWLDAAYIKKTKRGETPTIVMCGVDRNSGRIAAYDLSRKLQCPVVIMANEKESWSAMIDLDWPGLPRLQERVPEWWEPDGEVHVSCAQARVENPQTYLANLQAAIAGYTLTLLWNGLIHPEGLNLEELCEWGFTRKTIVDEVYELRWMLALSAYGDRRCMLPVEIYGNLTMQMRKYLAEETNE